MMWSRRPYDNEDGAANGERAATSVVGGRVEAVRIPPRVQPQGDEVARRFGEPASPLMSSGESCNRARHVEEGPEGRVVLLANVDGIAKRSAPEQWVM
jgi:hypothetical protein